MSHKTSHHPHVVQTPNRFLNSLCSHENNFNVVRLTLASLVVVYHAFCLNTANINAADQATKLLTQAAGIDLGRFAVDMFFVLSGIFVTQSWLSDPHITRFMVRRLVRLIPALFFCTVVIATIAVSFFSHMGVTGIAEEGFWSYVIRTSFLLDVINFGVYDPTIPGVFTGLNVNIINGSLWTLVWEARFYVILGLLGSTLVGNYIKILPLVCFALLLLIFFEKSLAEKLIWELDLFSCFLAGVIIRCLAQHVRSKVVFAGLAVVCGAWLYKFNVLAGFLIIGGAVTVLIGSADLILNRHMRFNDYSYGVHIYHWPIMQMIRSVSGQLAPLELLILTALAVFPPAVLSWHLIEAPSMAAVRNFLKPSRTLSGRALARAPTKTIA